MIWPIEMSKTFQKALFDDTAGYLQGIYHNDERMRYGLDYDAFERRRVKVIMEVRTETIPNFM